MMLQVKVSLVAALWTHRATSVANGSVEYQVANRPRKRNVFSLWPLLQLWDW